MYKKSYKPQTKAKTGKIMWWDWQDSNKTLRRLRREWMKYFFHYLLKYRSRICWRLNTVWKKSNLTVAISLSYLVFFYSFSKTAAGEEESYFWLLLRVLNYANAKDVYLVITITRSYCFRVICHKGGSSVNLQNCIFEDFWWPSRFRNRKTFFFLILFCLWLIPNYSLF